MISGHISSTTFPIYNCGEIMLDTTFYVQWWPSVFSTGSWTSFRMNGSTYYYSNYPDGYFTGFDGEITSQAFQNGQFDKVETNAKYIDFRAFCGCHNMSSASLPKCLSIGTWAFEDTDNLRTLTLPVCRYIGTEAFGVQGSGFTAESIYSLTLPSNSVCSISSNTFYTNSYYHCDNLNRLRGFICVPSSLVSAYKTAEYWSYISNRIFPIGQESYYIKWYPSTINSGEFNINGICFKFTEFSSGIFNTFDSAFSSAGRANYRGTDFKSNSEITNIETNMTAFIGSLNAFSYCSALSYADLSECLSIGVRIFYRCSNLVSVSLPKCEYIGPGAFYGCPLSEIILPCCSFIGATAFQSGREVIEGYDPTGNSAVRKIVAPSLVSVDSGTFLGFKNLSYVSLANCQYIGQDAFGGCSSLTDVFLPSCSSIIGGAFGGCRSLSSISLPVCSYIGSQVFTGAGLQTITLGSTSVCGLYDIHVFSGCPLSAIYVPSSLFSDYLNDSKWGNFAGIIQSIPY